MTGYLLDRDVLSAAENPGGNRRVHKWISGVPDSDLYISAITVMEARKGFSRQRAKARTAAQVEDVLGYEAHFDRLLLAYGERCLAIDRAVAGLWGEMLAERDVNVMDCAIAATAKFCGLVVATRNVRHFRGRGVPVINPFQAIPAITVA